MGSIKGQSVKGIERGVISQKQLKYIDEAKLRQKDLATAEGRERVKREFAETQTKFEISGPEEKDGMIVIQA